MVVEYKTSSANGPFTSLFWNELPDEIVKDLKLAQKKYGGDFAAFLYTSGRTLTGKHLSDCLVIFPGDDFTDELKRILEQTIPRGKLQSSRVVLGIFKDRGEMGQALGQWEDRTLSVTDLGLITIRGKIAEREKATDKKR